MFGMTDNCTFDKDNDINDNDSDTISYCTVHSALWENLLIPLLGE